MISRIRRRTAVVIMVLGLALGVPLGALASHQFADVPNSNPFHNDISALAASGVTTGCGGGNFCPSDYVTREQMAAFMNRLGSLDGVAVPSVNATKLDGLDSTAFHGFSTSAPAGGTMYGSFGASGVAAGAGAFDATFITFSVPLSAAPTGHVITPGDPVPAGCGGTASSPTASSGHLCVFVTYELNTSGGYTLFTPITGAPGTSRFGVAMDLASAAGGNYAILGTYAVNGSSALLYDDLTAGGGASLGE